MFQINNFTWSSDFAVVYGSAVIYRVNESLLEGTRKNTCLKRFDSIRYYVGTINMAFNAPYQFHVGNLLQCKWRGELRYSMVLLCINRFFNQIPIGRSSRTSRSIRSQQTFKFHIICRIYRHQFGKWDKLNRKSKSNHIFSLEIDEFVALKYETFAKDFSQ